MADSLTNITGLSSGIDYRSLVDQILKLDRRPADRMQATIDGNAKRKEALGQYQAALQALQTSAEALTSGKSLDKVVVATTGADAQGRALVAAAPGAGATPGSYRVVVERLATGQKTVGSAGVASTGALDVSGTFSVKGQDVVVDAADSLAAVRDKVNALAATTGVRASIVVGSANDARLVLASASTGAAGAFAVADVSGTLAAATFGLTGAPEPPAQDARVLVDGVPVERATNTVADAIPGVTLTLSAADPARTATVDVVGAPDAASNALKEFADAYNKARALSKTLTAAGGTLAGDTLVRSTAAGMSGLVLGADATLPADLTSLGAIGLSLQKDGTLAVDGDRLAAATARPDDLRAVLAARMGAMAEYVKTAAAPASGLVDQREDALTTQSGRLEARIADIDARLEKKRTAMLAQYARFEASLGRLKSIGDAIGAQLTSLTNSQSSNS